VSAGRSAFCKARPSGQVAQLVERSPEKAGVGGSIPSLATIISKALDDFTAFLQPTIQTMISLETLR
jgi:hypothetical protein